MARELHTKYRIRAAIPAMLVELAQLRRRALELGLQIAVDDSGNVEGVWDSSLLTLADVIRTLRQVGLLDFMIQKSVVSFTVAVKKNLSLRVLETARAEIGNDPDSCQDVLTDDTIFRFVVPCESAVSVATLLQGLGASKIIAHEAYEIEIEKTNV